MLGELRRCPEKLFAFQAELLSLLSEDKCFVSVKELSKAAKKHCCGLLSTEQTASLIKHLDLDQSGLIDWPELLAFFKHFEGLKSPLRLQLLKSAKACECKGVQTESWLKSNNFLASDILTYEQFAAVCSIMQIDQPGSQQLFQLLDEQKVGKVTVTSLIALINGLRTPPSGLKQALKAS